MTIKAKLRIMDEANKRNENRIAKYTASRRRKLRLPMKKTEKAV